MGRFLLVNPRPHKPEIITASNAKLATKEAMKKFIVENMPVALRKKGVDLSVLVSVVEVDDDRDEDIDQYSVDNDWQNFEVVIKRIDEKNSSIKVKSYEIPTDKKSIRGKCEIPPAVSDKMLVGGAGKGRKKKKYGSSLRRLNLRRYYSSWYYPYTSYYYLPAIYRSSKHMSWAYWYPFVNVNYLYSMGLRYTFV